MKKIFAIIGFSFFTYSVFSQDAIKVQNGGIITIQNGSNLYLQGGVTLENGSSLVNNGSLFLKNNPIGNISNWTDNSLAGALSGAGIVIFNSDHPQQFTGLTNFYTIVVNTNDLTLNNNLTLSNILRLISGKINTGAYYVFINNNLASAIETDFANSAYNNSWINGTLRRLIASNTNSYDFPIGNSLRSNLLKFNNNNLTGPDFLTASFGPKPGTDAGINVTEGSYNYTSVNNAGVWYLAPNTNATGGNYALHLYFNGFTGLTDNSFGILRRPDASSNGADWSVPSGSLLEPVNGTGRKLSDGFARRYNISGFSQFGIGQFTTSITPDCSITGASQVCPSSINNVYTGPAGMSSYNWGFSGSGTIVGPNNGQSISFTAGTGSSFSLTLNTTLNGIAAHCDKTVTISPTPTCDITGPSEVCAGSMNNIFSGPANMNTYSWTISAGGIIIGSNTGSSANITAGVPGTFTLTLDATGNGCTSHCSKTVTVKQLPACGITGPLTVTTLSVNNIYSAPANLDSYSWNINGNGTIVGSTTGQTVNITAGAPGSYALTLITGKNGCTSTCVQTVTVNPLVTLSCNITGVNEVCAGSTENTFSAPAGMNSYNWNISGNGIIIGAIDGQSVNVTVGGAGIFILTLQTTLNGISCNSNKTIKVIDCTSACTYTQGFYGNTNGMGCLNGNPANSSQLMQNAFGLNSSQVFGNVANKRFLTLFKTDITNGSIYKMLPGGGPSKSIDVDNILPYNGAYYSDQSTWSLVPLQATGPQKGKIKNSLLAQTMTLWFNLQNNASLGSMSLIEDTLVTKALTSCGSNTVTGNGIKFGLPHNVVVYLNGSNGYPATVSGLFNLANDVLGGANTMNASNVQDAVDVINNAFDGCRKLIATIPYNNPPSLPNNENIVIKEITIQKDLKVIAYPNPYENTFQLLISSAESGMATIEFLTVDGIKVYEMRKYVQANTNTNLLYTGPTRFTTLIYKVNVGKQQASGIVLKPN